MIFQGSIDVGELVSGEVTSLTYMDILEREVFRIGVDARTGGGRRRTAKPKDDSQHANDGNDCDDPREPIALGSFGGGVG